MSVMHWEYGMISSVTELREKYFGGDPHPYRIFEDTVLESLHPTHTVLDIGCR